MKALGNFREFDVTSKNFKNSQKLTSVRRISEIPRIWRHFLEEFFDRPPIVSCSPNTKWNFWTKIFPRQKNFDLYTFCLISRLLIIISKNVSNKSWMVSKGLYSGALTFLLGWPIKNFSSTTLFFSLITCVFYSTNRWSVKFPIKKY